MPSINQISDFPDKLNPMLRGITALSNEIRGNTIDLLCLTKLSAWRITFGKWVSIVSQSALILTAIVPYLILRYFFGDMQMFAELLLLLSTFLVSATLTAINVGLSGTNAILPRVLFPIFAAFITFVAVCITYLGGRNNFIDVLRWVILTDAQDWLTYLGFISCCAYLAWIFLDHGTSAIAPIAENRATLRRLVALALISATMLTFMLAEAVPSTALAIGLALCIPVAVISLTEGTQLVPPVVTPFTRKGLLGKAAGRLLYPGWATGLLYTLALYTLMQLAFHTLQDTPPEPDQTIALNSVFAMLLFPLALTRLFARNRPNRFGFYITFTLTQYLVLYVAVWKHIHSMERSPIDTP